MHIRHLIHLVLFTKRAPVRGSSLIAFAGQAARHAASSHCKHMIGTECASCSQIITDTRERPGLNSSSWVNEHASSQA
jgi:hypothetical protein